MKKLLFVLSLVLCISPIYAKEKNYIANDNVDTEGWRTITSIYENLYTNWGSAASDGLAATVDPSGNITYFLKICLNEGKLTMDEGSILLLKLGDGSTIELKSNYIGPADYEYQVSSYGTTYFVYPIYEITEAQIQKIIDSDVTKIRVQWTGGTFDKDIKKKKLSKHLSNVYPAIKNALNKEKTLYDDF